MGARRHGFLHLCPGPRTRAARPAAPLRASPPPRPTSASTAACSSPFSWSAGASRSSGDPWPTASAASAPWSSPSSATRSSLSWDAPPGQSGSSPPSASSPAWASAASGPWAASSSPKSGPNRAANKAPPGCTPATTSAAFLAAIVNYTIGAHYGWRAVFAVGGAPALLVAFIRYGVARARSAGSSRDRRARPRLDRARLAFFALFSPEYRRRTSGQRRAALRLHGGAVGRVGLRAVVHHRTGHPRRLHRHRSPRDWPPTPPCCSPPAPSWAASSCPPWPRRLGRRGTLAFYLRPDVRLHLRRLRLRLSISAATPCRGSWPASSCSASAAPISPSTRCGSPSSTAPNAAAAPSPSPPRSAASSPPASRSWWAPESPACTPSAPRWRSLPSPSSRASRCCPGRGNQR